MNADQQLRALLANQAPEDAAENAHWLDIQDAFTRPLSDLDNVRRATDALQTAVPNPASVWELRDKNNEPVHLWVKLLGEQSKSWNAYYAGVHHAVRAREAKRVHNLVEGVISGANVKFTSPVNIKITVYRGNLRRFDPDNVVAKFYIDGLVRGGVIDDDDYTRVNSVTTAVRIDKNNPRTVIEVAVI